MKKIKIKNPYGRVENISNFVGISFLIGPHLLMPWALPICFIIVTAFNIWYNKNNPE